MDRKEVQSHYHLNKKGVLEVPTYDEGIDPLHNAALTILSEI
jgi:hypothetical protein